ncbi:MAG: ankyrin repeat domain-containing protein [Marinifilaceae bacterium]|jgi:ankyrin repeat protein|nr:ankyrin repeat domain-containing protein [Marinifilaceae bacterium]
MLNKRYLASLLVLLLINIITNACTKSEEKDKDSLTANNESNISLVKYKKDDLHKAANKGDIELVKKILKTKIDVDARDSFGGTALHAAMFQTNIEIVELLLNAGFDINAQGSSNKYTPLHDAVWANNFDAVVVLIKNGADLTIKNKEGDTASMKAKKENKKRIYNYLIKIGK